VALALAWSWALSREVILLDLDLGAPALAVRLGRPPRPDVADAADEVHATGRIPDRVVQRVGPLRVIVGSHRNGDSPSGDSVEDVVSAASGAGLLTVIDAGPRSGDDPLLRRADEVVLVADGTPTGLVRAATLVSDWVGRRPRLVLNRVPDRARGDVVAAARRWTGLEPEGVIPFLGGVPRAACAAAAPARALRRGLRSMGVPR
jgi:MinD-like ATPase involved in chromosome partitioning or flagellar assembly